MKVFNSHGTKSSRPTGRGYKVLRDERALDAKAGVSSEPVNAKDRGRCKSVGGDGASVLGCNVNNANASARTVNGNNALSNSNDNYAGAFAVSNEKDIEIGKHSSTQSSRLNQTDIHAATGGYGQCDYGSLPFMEDGNAESNADASNTGNAIWTELLTANRKRKLKNLKRFLVNETIVRAGVERALKRASKSPEVRRAKKHKDEIVKRIIRELESETYQVGPIVDRQIPPKTSDGKWRNANIYTVYDRCVMNVLFLVVRTKLEHCISRHVYSGIPKRSIFSNTRKYRMADKIRHYVQSHPEDYAVLTDIRHFYENLSSKIALGILYKVIACPFTRKLLAKLLLPIPHLAIGSTLSQTIAMYVMTDLDEQMLAMKPSFYAVFGDNRLMCGRKSTILAMKSLESSYLAGRYGLPLKGDWSLCKVGDGFRFCKYDYRRSYVKPRGVLRRNAIRAASRGWRHYAGYKGILEKTDSFILRHLIENNLHDMKSRNGIEIRRMKGAHVSSELLEGERIFITDMERIENGKDSKYYLRIQAVHVPENGKQRLVTFTNGSYEIKEFFKAFQDGDVEKGFKTRLLKEGKSWYFEGYHVSNEEACETIIEDLGIDIKA